jgi:hypothetical protein
MRQSEALSLLIVSWVSVLMVARKKRTNDIFLLDKPLQFGGFAAPGTSLKH